MRGRIAPVAKKDGRAARLMLERAIRFLANSQHFCLNFY